jgi:CheY-like chemotaxis protein
MNPTPPRAEPRILLVDDAPENLAVLRDAFEESGYAVATAHNGAAALIKARATRPDLILLDTFMPGLDGMAVCRQLRGDPATRAIPVVFTTALTDAAHLRALFEAGATAYISKPIRRRQVVERVAALLRIPVTAPAATVLEASEAEPALPLPV